MKSLPNEHWGPVAIQILAYLRKHADARDTVEGIVEWWLLEQRIRIVSSEIEKALAELTAHGLLRRVSGRDGRVHYGLNLRKRAVVDDLLRETSPQLPAGPFVSTGGQALEQR